MCFKATIFRPLFSNRAMISPVRPRPKASGLTRIKVRSMGASFRVELGGGLGRRALGARAPAPAGLRRARGGVGADLGLAVRADPPRRIERPRAVVARVLELPHAARAPEEVILDLRVAVREVQEPGLREARIGRLHLELA